MRRTPKIFDEMLENFILFPFFPSSTLVGLSVNMWKGSTFWYTREGKKRNRHIYFDIKKSILHQRLTIGSYKLKKLKKQKTKINKNQKKQDDY